MEHFPTHELTVPPRFCGPASSGNGGWTSGALAAHVHADCPEDRAETWPTIEVTLRQPPPLDTILSVATSDGTTVVSFGGATVLSGRVVEDQEPRPVDTVPVEDARAAEASYAGHTFHPFPSCFACGTDRTEGDGLRIFPGRVSDAADGAARVAATWTPHPSVQEDWHEYVDDHGRASIGATWASLDCVGGWAGDLTERMMVLGRMTAAVDTLPAIGEEHVVMGEGRGRDGRKTFTASTLYDSDGRVVARAEHVWIAVDPGQFT